MALVIPDGYFQALVPLDNTLVQRQAAITFGVSGPETPTEPDDIANLVTLALADSIDTVLDPNVVIGPTTLTFDQGPGVRGSVTGNVTANGTRSTTNSTSPQIAAIFRKRTSRVGRPGRGRFFLPWAMDRDDVTEAGFISGDVLTGLQSAADALLTEFTAAGLGMVILHDETVPGSTAPSVVSSLSVDPQTGTQRRRNRG